MRIDLIVFLCSQPFTSIVLPCLEVFARAAKTGGGKKKEKVGTTATCRRTHSRLCALCLTSCFSKLARRMNEEYGSDVKISKLRIVFNLKIKVCLSKEN